MKWRERPGLRGRVKWVQPEVTIAGIESELRVSPA